MDLKLNKQSKAKKRKVSRTERNKSAPIYTESPKMLQKYSYQ